MDAPKKLLSLPDDVLGRIVAYLLTVSPSNPTSSPPLRHAIALSETCRRLQPIVFAQLHTADFLAPASHCSLSCRHTPRDIARLEDILSSAALNFRIIHLPYDYVPQDATYIALRRCANLQQLFLPARKELDPSQAYELFSSFPKLHTLALDLAKPSYLLGLANSDLCLKDVAITKLPAEPVSLNALSSFLKRKGPNLVTLRIHVITEESNWDYMPYLAHSWNFLQPLLEVRRALMRLSSILERHSEENELSSLRDLDISVIPDFPVSRTIPGVMSGARSRLAYLSRAVQSARETNQQSRGLRKLRFRVPADKLDSSIAFISKWVDDKVDATFSFSDCTLQFPHDMVQDGDRRPAKVMEIVLPGSKRFTGFSRLTFGHSGALENLFFSPLLADFGHTEVITLGNSLFALPTETVGMNLHRFLETFIKIERFHTLKVISDIPSTIVLLKIASCFNAIEKIPVKLLRMELPADFVLFSGAIKTLAKNSGRHVKLLWLSTFRRATIHELPEETAELEMASQPAVPAHCNVCYVSLDTPYDKALWFLKRLPKFLSLIKHSFPMLETLYMEKTYVTHHIDDHRAISMALEAIDCFENETDSDASTLRTEVWTWGSGDLIRLQ